MKTANERRIFLEYWCHNVSFTLLFSFVNQTTGELATTLLKRTSFLSVFEQLKEEEKDGLIKYSVTTIKCPGTQNRKVSRLFFPRF